MESPDLMESTLVPSSVGQRTVPGPLPLPKSQHLNPPYMNPSALGSNTHTPTSYPGGAVVDMPSFTNYGGTPMATTPSGGTSRTNLFIRYLPREIDDEELLRLFSPFGTIATSMVMRDIHTGESLGRAFVRYESPVDAEKARRAMDQYPIYSKKLSIQWARREHDFKTANNDQNKKQMYKLFLRNVPASATTDDLGRLLCAYGTVVGVSIHADTQQAEMLADGSGASHHYNPHTGTVSPTTEAARTPPSPATAGVARRIAFVTFAEEGAAERALKGVHHTCPFADCDGIPFMGKLINDNLLSKKQQQQLYSTPQSSLTPRALSIASAQNASLPSPTSSQGAYNSFARSPNASGMSFRQTPVPPMAGVQQQPSLGNISIPSRGNSMAGDGFYPVLSDRLTPASESTSVTPRMYPAGGSASGDRGHYSSQRGAHPPPPQQQHQQQQQSIMVPPTKPLVVPLPLSQRSLQSNHPTTPTNINPGNSPAASTPTSSTPSRTRRYTHNPYSAVVLQ